MQALPVVWSVDCREAACLGISNACLSGGGDFVFLPAAIVDQAEHRFFQESGCTGGTALGDLPLNFALKFVRKLNCTHGEPPATP